MRAAMVNISPMASGRLERSDRIFLGALLRGAHRGAPPSFWFWFASGILALSWRLPPPSPDNGGAALGSATFFASSGRTLPAASLGVLTLHPTLRRSRFFE